MTAPLTAPLWGAPILGRLAEGLVHTTAGLVGTVAILAFAAALALPRRRG